MKLYLVTRTDKDSYADVDEIRAMIIRADDPEQAREFAAAGCADEGHDCWFNAITVELKDDGLKGIILRDYSG